MRTEPQGEYGSYVDEKSKTKKERPLTFLSVSLSKSHRSVRFAAAAATRLLTVAMNSDEGADEVDEVEVMKLCGWKVLDKKDSKGKTRFMKEGKK